MTGSFRRILVLLLFSVFISAPGTVPLAAAMDDRMVVQVTYGLMVIPNDDSQKSGEDYDISLVGAAAQKPFGGDLFKYGIETGAYFNWQSEIRYFGASSGSGGGTAVVSMDIESFIFDYFGGGYVSVRPVKWIRFYAGGGPLLIYGYRATEEDNPDVEGVMTGSESDLSVGVYGRTGIDLVFADKVLLGCGIRGTVTGLSFEDNTGKLNVEGLQYYAGGSFYFD